jgi:predicted DNA-binding transcriptional regulator YafY
MFERDKDTLRDAGIPIDVTPTDPWDVEQGYRIWKERFYLPDLQLTPDEVWALFVAAHTPGEDPEAERAFQKLSTSAEAGVLAAIAERLVTPGADPSGPHLGPIADALASRRAVRFKYRPLQGKPGQREVDPYGLVFRSGNWYLVGRDRTREDVRSFRLSRVASAIKGIGPASPSPEGFDAAKHLEAGPWGLGRPAQRATIAFSPKVAWWALSEAPGARSVQELPDGWIEADVPASESESFVSWVLSFGPDARVESPASLRDQVVAKLQAITSLTGPNETGPPAAA